jgi:hypothetical protein
MDARNLHPEANMYAARRWLFLLSLASLAVASCAPVVTHSPRVTPGPSATVTAGYSGRFACYERVQWDWERGERTDHTDRACREPQHGPAPLLLSLGWGWRATPESGGYRLGIDALAVPAMVHLDGYWQAPKRGGAGLDWGLGAVFSGIHVAPYAQIGRIGENGRGWFTTQMVAVPHPLVGTYQDYGPGLHSTVAYQLPYRAPGPMRGADAVLRLFLSGGLERLPVESYENGLHSHLHARNLSGGVMIEVFAGTTGSTRSGREPDADLAVVTPRPFALKP